MHTQYYIIIDGQQAGPFSKEDLLHYNLTADSLVWRQGLPEWSKASNLPEISDILMQSADNGYANKNEDSYWFAIINGQQTGPYPVETLISMGLTPASPVWRNGMADWMDAATQPEIMSHFGTTPPPHTNQTYGQNPQYGQRPDFSNNPQYKDFGQNSFNNNNPYNNYNQGNRYNPGNQWNFRNQPGGNPMSVKNNWLPWAIVATIAALIFSCVGSIFGVIGIINANKANNFYAQGFDEMGDQANNTARTMTIIALALAGIGFFATIVIRWGYPGFSIF